MNTPVAPKGGGVVRSSGGHSSYSPSAPSSAAVSISSSSAAKKKGSPSDKVTSRKCLPSEQDVITLDSDGEEWETPKKACKKIPRNDGDDDDDIMELPTPRKSANNPSTLKNCTPKAVETEKSPAAAQPAVLQVSLKAEEQDVEMAEAANGPQPNVLLPSKASEPMDVATVTSGVEKAGISNITMNMPEAMGDGLPVADEKEKTPQTPVVQTSARGGPSDEAKPTLAKDNNEEPGPSGSRPNSEQQQAGNATEVEGDRNDEDGYEEDEDDEDAQDGDDETEEELVDEDGIPLANIAKLTPDELKSLQKLKMILKERQQRLRNLDEYVLPSNISDKEYKFFLKTLNEARNHVADCAEAICKVCKVKDEDYDKEILTFKFTGSGNSLLDKFVTIWVLRMIRPEFGGSLDVETAKNLEDSPIGDFTEMKLQSVRRLIKVLARSRLNCTTIPHRVHGRSIRADDVFEMLMEDIKQFRALVYNRLVLPKYTLGNTDLQSLHNPRLPKDPELLEKLKRNTKTNLHAATLEVAEKFEERLIREGVQVARRGPNDRGPDPSHSDDEHDSADYTDAESDEEEGGDVEMKDERQPSGTAQAAAASRDEKSPQPIAASARPDSAGVKRKDPSTPKESEGPVPKKKEASPAQEKVAGGELHKAESDAGRMASVLPVDACEFKGDETDDDDLDSIDDADGLEALLSEVKLFPTN